MKLEYEVNNETLAILPYELDCSKIIELNETFVVKKKPIEIIRNSCAFFGCSYDGRHEGTKKLIGVNYKAPIIIEESSNIIFFPTCSPRFNDCMWISHAHILKCENSFNNAIIYFKNGFKLPLKISYGSLKNQILRSSLLENVFQSRKILK